MVTWPTSCASGMRPATLIRRRRTRLRRLLQLQRLLLRPLPDLLQGTTMTVTLYDCATAPSPRRARILLAEKGVAHDTVAVDLRHGEQLSDAYRKVNPQCTVPA